MKSHYESTQVGLEYPAALAIALQTTSPALVPSSPIHHQCRRRNPWAEKLDDFHSSGPKWSLWNPLTWFQAQVGPRLQLPAAEARSSTVLPAGLHLPCLRIAGHDFRPH